MTAKSSGTETVPARRILNEKVRAIYAAPDEAAVETLTQLLATALRAGDHDSRSALGQFLDSPVTSLTDSDCHEHNQALLSHAMVFINGENANRVQTWISAYTMSAEDSDCRSIHEDMLRNFVLSTAAVERMKL